MEGSVVSGTPLSLARRFNLGPDVQYVADTGPLLCLGDFRALRTIFKQRCHGKTHWVVAVRAELADQARRNDRIAAAAKSYEGRGAAWLTGPIAFAASDDVALARIRARMRQLAEEAAKRRGENPPADHARAHLGETQSILHASRNSLILLTHDGDAHTAAKEHGLRSATLIDIAQQLLFEGVPGITADSLYRGFISAQSAKIFPGRHLRGPLDLNPFRVPGPRPPTR